MQAHFARVDWLEAAYLRGATARDPGDGLKRLETLIHKRLDAPIGPSTRLVLEHAKLMLERRSSARRRLAAIRPRSGGDQALRRAIEKVLLELS